MTSRLSIVDDSCPVAPEKSSAPRSLLGPAHPTRKLYLHTFGCQMNEHDTERMTEILARRGFAVTDLPDEADLVIMNTCSVRELAVQKALSELGRLRVHKETRGTRIAVTGCVAQQEGASLLKKYKDIDLVLGPDNIYQLGELVDRVFQGERLTYAELDETAGFHFLTHDEDAGLRKNQLAAFVTVQKGCDKKCSYCIVPRVRGAEVSRPLEEIVAEVEGLVARGIRDVTLLGQNIDAYRDPQNRKFDVLLRAVGAVVGIWRVRFTTSHPNDFSPAMAQAMAETQTVCEHLHLPAQSGSDGVLKRMYRGYSQKRYLEKIAMVRALIPDVRLTTDLIVGFPGETEEDFQETLKLVQEARFDGAFVFAYSVRPGTPAEPWPDDVPEATKRERLHRLNEAMRVMSIARAARFVGQALEVMVEGPSRTNPNVLTGRSRHNHIVLFTGEAEPGTLVHVRIDSEESGYWLKGTLLTNN
jgi:tRNA-2-methylthio-N6-dimethylallyladenosine synthase